MKSKGKKQQVKFYICPKCRSTNVRYVLGFENLFGLWPRMRCGTCRFTGMFPLIVMDKNKLDKMNKMARKVKK